MEDRLAELKNASGGIAMAQEDAVALNTSNNNIKGKSAAPPPASTGEESEEMNQFFKEVGDIKAAMANIKKNTKQLEEKYGQALTSVNGDDRGVQKLVDATDKNIMDIKKMLSQMAQQNKEFQQGKVTATEVRIRHNMHITLTQKFMESARVYQELQTTYKHKFEEKIERQIKIAKPEATQEEIEQAIDSGDSSKIFTAQILNTQQAKNALAYIEAKHEDIKKIEASIRELHQLFVDMAIIVDSQGEMLDQIEFIVADVNSLVAAGVKEMEGAVKEQRKLRKFCIVM